MTSTRRLLWHPESECLFEEMNPEWESDGYVEDVTGIPEWEERFKRENDTRNSTGLRSTEQGEQDN